MTTPPLGPSPSTLHRPRRSRVNRRFNCSLWFYWRRVGCLLPPLDRQGMPERPQIPHHTQHDHAPWCMGFSVERYLLYTVECPEFYGILLYNFRHLESLSIHSVHSIHNIHITPSTAVCHGVQYFWFQGSCCAQ